MREANRLLAPDALGRTSMKELVVALRRVGFGAAGVKIGRSSFSKLRVPVILHLDENHFAVACVIEPGSVMLIDVPVRRSLLTIEQLYQGWDGACVLVAKDDVGLIDAMEQLGINSRAQS